MLNKLFAGKKSNRLYSGIFLSLVITVVITILILSTVLYINFETISLSLIHTSIEDSLTQISYSTAFMTDSYKSLAYKIYIDNYVSKLFYLEPSEYNDLNQAFTQLNSYLSTMPFVHSIYVYTGNHQKIYTQTFTPSIYTADDFYDRDIMKILSNKEQYTLLAPIPRRIEDNNGQSVNMYSFIFTGSVGDKIGNTVVLNVSESWMRKAIDSMDTFPGSRTFIINETGHLVLSEHNNELLTDLSDREYIQKILASTKASDYFVADVDGIKSLVATVSSEQLKWKIVRIIPQNTLTGQIQAMRTKTLAFAFILLVSGLLVSVILSRWLYKPINRMKAKLDALELEKRDSLHILKRDFLRSLLQIEIDYSTDILQKKLESFGIQLNHTLPFILIMLKIDSFTQFSTKYNAKETDLLRFGICNIANELCAVHFNNEAFDVGEDHIVVLANINSNTCDADLNNTLLEIIGNIQESVEKYLEIALSAVISQKGSSIRDMGYLYEEVLYNSNYRLYYGSGCIITSDTVSELKSKEYSYPIKKEELLIDALMLGKPSVIHQIYNEIMEDAAKYSYNAFNSAVLRMALSINTAIDKIEKINGLPLSYNFSSFISRLNSLESISDIHLQFLTLFDDILLKLEARKSKKYDEVIQHAIEIIERNYSNQIISLESIADTVNMSSVYLARLFKKATTRSIPDYINDLRIEKAKELLTSTSHTVQQIAEATGFASSTYFYTVFKKVHGITPNDYRKNNPVNV